ncbi:hypothetical protein ABIB53_000009 [Janibacter sp. UYMM211]
MVVTDEGGLHPRGTRTVPRGLMWGDQQVAVVWLDPHDPDAPLPAGLTSFPKPGQVAISPGLRDAGFLEASAGMQVGQAGSGPDGTIGPSGLASANELLIYARPAKGRELGVDGASWQLITIGAPSTDVTVSDPATQPWPLMVETSQPSPTVARELYSAAILGGVPALILLVAASGAMSAVRRGRIATLRRLGISSGSVRAITGVEAALLAGCGAVAGGLMGWLITRQMTGLPGSGLRYFTGDLSVDASWSALTVLIVVVTAAVLAASRLPREQDLGSAQTWFADHSKHLLGMLALAAVGMVVAGLLDAPRAIFVALIIAAILLPLAQPAAMSFAAAAIPARRASLAVAVRRVAHKPLELAAPAGVVSALVLLAMAGGGIQARLLEPIVEQTTAWQERAQVEMTWQDPRPGDLDLLRAGGAQVKAGSAGGEAVVTGTVEEVRSVEARANRSLAAPNILDLRQGMSRPDTTWVIPTTLWATGVLILAGLVTLGNRVLGLVRDDVRMLRSGLGQGDVLAVQRWELAIAVLAASCLGGLVGTVFLVAGELVDISRLAGVVILIGPLIVLLMGGVVTVLERTSRASIRRARDD